MAGDKMAESPLGHLGLAARLMVAVSFLCLMPACKSRKCAEKVLPDCNCVHLYDPVCGCNGKTYPNACVAECHSIKKYTKGECR